MPLPGWAKQEHIDCIARLTADALGEKSQWKLVNVRPESFGGGGLDRQYEVIVEDSTARLTRAFLINFVEFDDLFNERNERRLRDLVRRAIEPLFRVEI